MARPQRRSRGRCYLSLAAPSIVSGLLPLPIWILRGLCSSGFWIQTSSTPFVNDALTCSPSMPSGSVSVRLNEPNWRSRRKKPRSFCSCSALRSPEMTGEPSFSSMFTSLSVRPGRSARSRKWSSCSTRSIAGVQRCATWLRSKSVLKSRSKSAASGSGRMRRAISMTSWDEKNLTWAQCRYLSPYLSTFLAGSEEVPGIESRLDLHVERARMAAFEPADAVLAGDRPSQLLGHGEDVLRCALGEVRIFRCDEEGGVQVAVAGVAPGAGREAVRVADLGQARERVCEPLDRHRHVLAELAAAKRRDRAVHGVAPAPQGRWIW